MSRSRQILFYAGFIAAWTIAITGAGALLGGIIFPLVGLIVDRDTTLAAMALSGARNLGFFAFVWAPGTAIVLAFRHAFRRRKLNGSALN